MQELENKELACCALFFLLYKVRNQLTVLFKESDVILFKFFSIVMRRKYMMLG